MAALPLTRLVLIPPTPIAGELQSPARARGLVIFAHGSGSSRFSPRNRQVAGALVQAGMATLLLDLLTEAEAGDRANVFDIDLLGERLVEAIDWARSQPTLAVLPIGLFGASTGAAAALRAAAARPASVAAVVSRGGRPDLAANVLGAVEAATLFIVGGDDEPVITWNRQALQSMDGLARLVIVPRAGHLFEEPGALEAVIAHARAWFLTHLAGVVEPAGAR